MKNIKKIGVLTSGGDAPGMNAAIRAVVRTAVYYNLEVIGIKNGYDGLIQNKFITLKNYSVSDIIQKGGTIIKSARSEEFKTAEGMQKACDNLTNAEIDSLIVIGGDGTFTGANEFGKKYDFPIIGLPGTIDNDLFGTDFTIGYDTALNTVVDAIDKIRDTAYSHNRLFFIEVMGRDAGFIALRSGIAGGAEDILIPETETHIDNLIHKLEHDWRHNKKSGIIIVAEGDDAGGAYEIAQKVTEKFKNYKTRVTVLGHIQRGGSPSCMDRVLASTLGYEAVKALLNNKRDVMVGQKNNKIVFTPFAEAIKHHQDINRDMLEMARILSL
ncbi:MAG: 6-phosphofructokinase [Bacteroidales bacterium]|nr:6-phosphofructokinase [Bacteroidales bacterium]